MGGAQGLAGAGGGPAAGSAGSPGGVLVRRVPVGQVWPGGLGWLVGPAVSGSAALRLGSLRLGGLGLSPPVSAVQPGRGSAPQPDRLATRRSVLGLAAASASWAAPASASATSELCDLGLLRPLGCVASRADWADEEPGRAALTGRDTGSGGAALGRHTHHGPGGRGGHGRVRPSQRIGSPRGEITIRGTRVPRDGNRIPHGRNWIPGGRDRRRGRGHRRCCGLLPVPARRGNGSGRTRRGPGWGVRDRGRRGRVRVLHRPGRGRGPDRGRRPDRSRKAVGTRRSGGPILSRAREPGCAGREGRPGGVTARSRPRGAAGPAARRGRSRPAPYPPPWQAAAPRDQERYRATGGHGRAASPRGPLAGPERHVAHGRAGRPGPPARRPFGPPPAAAGRAPRDGRGGRGGGGRQGRGLGRRPRALRVPAPDLADHDDVVFLRQRSHPAPGPRLTQVADLRNDQLRAVSCFPARAGWRAR